MNGDKSIDSIVNQFNDVLSDFNDVKINESALPSGYKNVLTNDTYIGILQSLEEIEWEYTEGEDGSPEWYYNKFILKVILNKINTVFGVVANNKKMFEGVPSASVQAMMVSLANAVIYGFIGSEFNIERNDARISLLSKCAIDSDATIGFNLPLIDPKKPDDGNFFVSIMNQFKNAEISSKEIDDVIEQMSVKDIKMIYKSWGEDTEDDSGENDEKKYKSEFNKKVSSKLMKQFKRNIDKLFNIILDKANKIKDAAEKKEKVKQQKHNENLKKKMISNIKKRDALKKRLFLIIFQNYWWCFYNIFTTILLFFFSIMFNLWFIFFHYIFLFIILYRLWFLNRFRISCRFTIYSIHFILKFRFNTFESKINHMRIFE